MVDASLVKYVKDYHEKGYSYSTLRQYLVSQGYNQADVDAAITATMQPHKSTKLYIILAAVVVVLIIAVLGFLLLSGPVEVDISTSASQNVINKGDRLSFTADVVASKNVDATIRYALLREGVIETSSFKQISTEQTSHSFTLTPKQTGTYKVETTIQHKDGQQTSSFIFSVEAICGDNICDLTEDQNSCAQDCAICGDEICSPNENCPQDCQTTTQPVDPEPTDPEPTDPVTPNPNVPTQPQNDCGNGICNLNENELLCPSDCAQQGGLSGLSYLQLTRYVEEQVQSKGPESVATECATITDINNRDECYYQIMRTALDAKYCPPIDGQIKRDDCYFTYSHNSQTYSTCDKIVDSYRRETCETLKRQKELRDQYI